MKKLFFLLVMCFAALTMQAQLKNEYVDMGLPSGTKWKTKNEAGGLYDWDSAINKFGDKMPTKEQWEELMEKCTWSWTDKGYKVTSKNGKSIFLPAAGFRSCDGNVNSVGGWGRYWSSTPCTSEQSWWSSKDEEAWGPTFYHSSVDMVYQLRCYGYSVRLVKK